MSAAFFALAAASLPAEDPPARALLREAVAAQGSAAAIAAVHSVTAVADCVGPRGVAFTTEVVSERPDRARFRQNFGGIWTELTVVGDRGWTRDERTGAVEKVSKDLVGIVRGHEFHFLFLDLDRRNRDARSAGRDTVGGRPCLVVKMTDPGGRPASVCIDEETKLPTRLSYEPPGGPKPGTIHVFPTSWQTVAGVHWVSAFELRQNDEVFTYRYTSIRPNAVDPRIFSIPSGL
jgi:hypothetical protein